MLIPVSGVGTGFHFDGEGYMSSILKAAQGKNLDYLGPNGLKPGLVGTFRLLRTAKAKGFL